MRLKSEDKLAGFLSEEDNVVSYKWMLDNKYYTADINLSILKCKYITSPEFAETVEAVILYVDTQKVSLLSPYLLVCLKKKKISIFQEHQLSFSLLPECLFLFQCSALCYLIAMSR